MSTNIFITHTHADYNNLTKWHKFVHGKSQNGTNLGMTFGLTSLIIEVRRTENGAGRTAGTRQQGRDRGASVVLRTRSCFFDSLTVPNTDMQRKKGGYGTVFGLDGLDWLDRGRFPGWRDGDAVDTTSPTIPSTKGYPDRIVCREGLRADPAGIGCAADATPNAYYTLIEF